MDAGVVTIIAALIAALPPTLTAILSSKKNRDSIKDVAQKVDRTEDELKRQGKLLAKTERAFRERKKHEELQNEIALANMTSTQVILEALHREGKINGDCSQQRDKLKELEHKMAAQALHLEDDDIKY